MRSRLIQRFQIPSVLRMIDRSWTCQNEFSGSILPAILIHFNTFEFGRGAINGVQYGTHLFFSFKERQCHFPHPLLHHYPKIHFAFCCGSTLNSLVWDGFPDDAGPPWRNGRIIIFPFSDVQVAQVYRLALGPEGFACLTRNRRDLYCLSCWAFPSSLPQIIFGASYWPSPMLRSPRGPKL
jgi:hypothetical protein